MVPDEYASCFVEGVIGQPGKMRRNQCGRRTFPCRCAVAWTAGAGVGLRESGSTVLSELAVTILIAGVELTGQLLSLTAEFAFLGA